MRLSRTDKVPVLTIVVGGAFGFAFSLGFLAWTATDDVDHDSPSVFTTPIVEMDRTQEPAVEGPIFTPMTVRPEITNRSEVQAALMR
jgi:hypothetical protein